MLLNGPHGNKIDVSTAHCLQADDWSYKLIHCPYPIIKQQNMLVTSLDEEKNGYEARDQLLYEL